MLLLNSSFAFCHTTRVMTLRFIHPHEFFTTEHLTDFFFFFTPNGDSYEKQEFLALSMDKNLQTFVVE